MSIAYDQTIPHTSRWGHDGAEYVRSNIDWCARCAKRLVALDPALGAEDAMNLAQTLSLDDDLRARTPELVAEDLNHVDVSLDD